MDDEDFQFDFEKLEVYQLALGFLDFIFAACNKVPRNLQYCLGDNLKGAGISVLNNIAEGSGRKSGKEKARVYGKRTTSMLFKLL